MIHLIRFFQSGRHLLESYQSVGGGGGGGGGVLSILQGNINYHGNNHHHHYRNDVKKNDDELSYWHSSGKMSYHCPRCNAGYTYKKTLKTHMKYDCGKEPRFKCPYCNKRDKCSSNIYKHIRMRHDGLPVTVERN